jgi:hypothetical protein
MKFIKTRLLWILMTICIAIVSCKKETVKEENHFSFRDTTYVTDHGYISKAFTTETQSFYLIYLCSPNLNYIDHNFSGKGDVVYIVIVSDSPDEIIPGMYVNVVNLSSLVLLDYDAESNTKVQYSLDPVLSSTADIKVVDDVYEIEYKLTLSTGEVLKGKYKGALENFIFSFGKNNKSNFFNIYDNPIN